jgi:hypothetical protein
MKRYGEAERFMMLNLVMLGLMRVVVQQPCFVNDSYYHASLVEQLTRSPESDHFAILANVSGMRAVWQWVLEKHRDRSQDLSWWADNLLGAVRHAVTKMVNLHKICSYVTVFQVVVSSNILIMYLTLYYIFTLYYAIHTYTHTYIHTYIHSYIHIYIYTYIHTYTTIHTTSGYYFR